MPICSCCGTHSLGRFCSQCGAPLQRSCSLCGAPVEADARFCASCGSPLPPESAPPGTPSPASVRFGDIGFVRGGIEVDASVHVGTQMNITGPVTVQVPPRPDVAELLQKARQLLSCCAYREAIAVLREALQAAPLDPEANLLMGLALLEGRNPAVLGLATVKKAEKHLVAAWQEGCLPLALIALGVIKHDYYAQNGMDEGTPSLQEITQHVDGMDIGSVDRDLLSHLKASFLARRALGLEW